VAVQSTSRIKKLRPNFDKKQQLGCSFMLGYYLQRSFKTKTQRDAGFTLIEILVAALIVGILSAIAAPSWLAYMSSQRAKDANERSFYAIRSAQSQAIQTRSTYRTSFRRVTISGETFVQYAIHPVPSGFTYSSIANLVWETLPEFSLLDTTNTTLTSITVSGTTFYYAEFDFQGVASALGRITFEATSGGLKESCTYISTLIGGMRIASDEGCR
jgi:prepilin-type N-terminal cleavage/methylation domain-containing protein